jgi:O-antigen ligase
MNEGRRADSTAIVSRALFVFLAISLVALSVSIALSSIAFGAAVLLLVAQLALDPSSRVRTPIDLAVVAYCCAELLATIWSIDKPASAFNMKRLLLILVVPMTIISLRDERRFTTMLAVLFGSVALLSVVEVIAEFAKGAGVERLGMFQHYMTTGGIKMLILLLAFPFLVDRRVDRRWRLAALAGIVPIILALILTETRGSWLGLVAGIAVYGLMRNRMLLAGLGLAVALFLAAAPAHWKERAFSIVDIHHYSNVERFNKWIAGSRMILDYPVLGTGDIDLGQIYSKYKEPTDPTLGGHLHNNVLMLIVTLGAVGFLAVMYLFVKILLAEIDASRATRGSWLYGNAAAGSLAAYAGFHVNGLFEWNFGDHEIAVLLWFTVGLAFAAVRLARAEAERSAAR